MKASQAIFLVQMQSKTSQNPYSAYIVALVGPSSRGFSFFFLRSSCACCTCCVSDTRAAASRCIRVLGFVPKKTVVGNSSVPEDCRRSNEVGHGEKKGVQQREKKGSALQLIT